MGDSDARIWEEEDLLFLILGRLPAVSFASAACVSKTWHRVCSRILSRPKLASALSLNSSPLLALQEVLDKVLSQPIFPHFAIAHVLGDFCLAFTLQYIVGKLGSNVSVVVSRDSGIIGRDVATGEVREAKLNAEIGAYDGVNALTCNQGIVLTVGFMPGLKVDAIPLLRMPEEPAMVDKFIEDIRGCSICFSGQPSPIALVIFGDSRSDVKYVIDKLDYAMPAETVIVGDEKGRFLYQSAGHRGKSGERREYFVDAIALVFARDKDKTSGAGEIKFHMALSDSMLVLNAKYKTSSVRATDCDTWLTAKQEGQREILDGQRMLDGVNAELVDRVEYPDLYIGVTKRRRYCIRAEKPKLVTSLAFHGVLGGDEEYLYVDGVGIKTGDCFQFFYSDPVAAVRALDGISVSLRSLDDELGSAGFPLHTRGVGAKAQKRLVFGGLIFACCGRGEPYFRQPNVDTAPFVNNFPEVPVAGVFCGGEIGRSSSCRDGLVTRSCCHVYSSVYLVMTYDIPSYIDG
ncbi:hypothetical protein MLD38_027885 [Melastoma candidum]|uniref:Uncharacterized protein n=1 Tax=Melastoma candidum TaxID=119954 RepID=A0ACB9MZ81_9MYRT|nr:hypothetical protein MLD38_027885 [Melastoma candidum]